MGSRVCYKSSKNGYIITQTKRFKQVFICVCIFKWYEGHWLEAQYVTMCKNVPPGRLTTTKKSINIT